MILLILLIAFLVLLIIGMPVGYSMGIASLVSLFLMPNAQLDILPSRMFAGVDSFSLMAIPFSSWQESLCIIMESLTWATLYLSFLKAIRTTSTILIIVSMANVFSWIVGFEKLPMRVSEFFITFSDNKYVVMLCVMVFLLVLGLFMETISALILLVPVLSPLAQVFHIDPVHFATVVVITLLIGAVHPPIGILLFITTKMANCRIRDTLPYLLPFLGIMIAVIILLIFVPQLVTALPNMF